VIGLGADADTASDAPLGQGWRAISPAHALRFRDIEGTSILAERDLPCAASRSGRWKRAITADQLVRAVM
jgi:hypothetical protein